MLTHLICSSNDTLFCTASYPLIEAEASLLVVLQQLKHHVEAENIIIFVNFCEK